MENRTKEWWRSKTLWWNVAAIALLVLQGLGAGEVRLEPEIVALIAALVNVILRFATDTKLEV